MDKKNPLRILLRVTISLFIILLIVFIGLKVVTVYEPDGGRKLLLTEIVSKIESISLLTWNFLKPFLQLIVILLIVEWLLGKFGFSFTSKESKVEWNVQTIIALVIVSSFALAALSGIEGVGYLKDLSLVVVGFYFGSQKRIVEYKNAKGEVKVIEEHTNDDK